MCAPFFVGCWVVVVGIPSSPKYSAIPYLRSWIKVYTYLDPGRAGETPPQTKTSSSSIMNCFQHTPESCGALHTPAGEHPTKKAFLHKHALTGFTTHAYLFKRLALPRLPQHLPFFASPHVRYTCTPTQPRSTGFSAIWDSTSSSSNS